VRGLKSLAPSQFPERGFKRYKRILQALLRYGRDFPRNRSAASSRVNGASASGALNVCVDGLCLADGYLGCGINRYLVNLLRQIEMLTAGSSIRTQILVESLDANRGNGLVQRAGFEMVPCAVARSSGIWHPIMLMETAKRLEADVVFMPAPGVVHFKRTRLAVTVHDVIPLLFPDEFRSPEEQRLSRRCLAAIQKADLILTDSRYSKSDMVDRFGVPPDKVVVVYLGLDGRMFQALPPNERAEQQVLKRHGIDRPYFLHVGLWQPRKNLHRLIRAFRLLEDRARDLGLQLVLCGPRKPGIDKLDELVQELSLQGKVVLTGKVPDSDLVELYQRAHGFAMPSLYEGFGLPPLEAMACGVPVMSSNRSSLPEVLGDAAVYCDPESEDDMACALEKICRDSGLRKTLVDRGLAHVTQFSWEACARSTLAALQQLT
jgi:glycosyltransferase involved in cell wall biosynthesis